MKEKLTDVMYIVRCVMSMLIPEDSYICPVGKYILWHYVYTYSLTLNLPELLRRSIRTYFIVLLMSTLFIFNM